MFGFERQIAKSLSFFKFHILATIFVTDCRMKIDFRETCHLCGDDSAKALACGETKIGNEFKNTFVKPIETPETDEISLTPNKRLDRCFIVNTGSKSHAPLYNKARNQLKQICIDILTKSDFVELSMDQVTV